MIRKPWKEEFTFHLNVNYNWSFILRFCVHLCPLVMVGWLVGCLVCQQMTQKLGYGLFKAWIEDVSPPSVDLITFWCRSKNFFSLSWTLWNRTFFHTYVHFSGTNAWILMKELPGGWYLWVSTNRTVWPCRRFALYWVPFYSGNYFFSQSSRNSIFTQTWISALATRSKPT